MFSNQEIIDAALKCGDISQQLAIELGAITSESILLYELKKKSLPDGVDFDSHIARLKSLAYQNRNPHLTYEQSMIEVANFI